MDKVKRNFTEINPASLSGKAAKAYAELKAAQGVANAKREAFDTLCINALSTGGHIPAGKAAVISHMFGKLSFEIVDATSAKAVAAKKTPINL